MSTMTSPRTHLKKLVGEWKGSGTMTVPGDSLPITGRWHNELIAASYGVLCQVRLTGIPGVEEFVEFDQIGYDDLEQQFHMGSVCNFGETHDLRGDWQDDRLLVQDDRMSYEIRVVSTEHLKVRVVNTGDGPVFDVDFEK